MNAAEVSKLLGPSSDLRIEIAKLKVKCETLQAQKEELLKLLASAISKAGDK